MREENCRRDEGGKGSKVLKIALKSPDPGPSFTLRQIDAPAERILVRVCAV